MAEANSSRLIKTEIEQLQKQPGLIQVKLLPGIADVTDVVSVSTSSMKLKYQILADYPGSLPIVIMSTQEENEKLEQVLQEAEKHRGKPMLLALTTFAMSLFPDEGLPSKELHANHSKIKRQKGKPSSAATQRSEEKSSRTKKLPMRTATDVIHRILWDSELQKENFSIGYLDRFVGVVEKNFTDFSWEDIASVDYGVLAIPKHRIQYFKYCGVKVWDKQERLDDVFGSTGRGKTISHVVNLKQKESGASNSDAVNSNHSLTNEIDLGKNFEQKLHLSSSHQDSLAGMTHFENQITICKTERATHILCIQITAPEILENVKKFQSFIEEEMPLYTRLLTPVNKMHVTLMALNLDTTEKVQQVKDKLQNLEQSRNRKQANLDIAGLNLFGKSLVCARVKPSDDLLEFQNLLESNLGEFIVNNPAPEEIDLHMTLLKLRKSDKEDMGIESLNANIFNRVNKLYFGQEKVCVVHLCQVTSKGRDCFYDIITSTKLRVYNSSF